MYLRVYASDLGEPGRPKLSLLWPQRETVLWLMGKAWNLGQIDLIQREEGDFGFGFLFIASFPQAV